MTEDTLSTEVTPIDETAQKPIEIDWFDEGDLVRVNPQDQMRFEIHKDRVIRLLQLHNEAERQLELLIHRLQRWTHAHSAKVSESYLTLRGDRLGFFAVSNSAKCDDELEDSISDLDLEIANDSDLESMQVNAMVLPPASSVALSSFFDERFLLVFRGVGS
jgi:hypothetical protein